MLVRSKQRYFRFCRQLFKTFSTILWIFAFGVRTSWGQQGTFKPKNLSPEQTTEIYRDYGHLTEWSECPQRGGG